MTEYIWRITQKFLIGFMQIWRQVGRVKPTVPLWPHGLTSANDTMNR